MLEHAVEGNEVDEVAERLPGALDPEFIIRSDQAPWKDFRVRFVDLPLTGGVAHEADALQAQSPQILVLPQALHYESKTAD